jgi:hypothetical protein
MKKLAAVVFLLINGSLAQAAQTFNFSYAMYDGPVVTGSFSGDLNGNLITNLTNVSVQITGKSIFAGAVQADAGAHGTIVPHAAVASLDGLANDFFFHDAAGSWFYTIPWSNWSGITDAAQVRILPGAEYAVGSETYIDYFNGNYNAANWHIAAAVPEPETYAMMLAGLGLAGIAARRRRNRA